VGPCRSATNVPSGLVASGRQGSLAAAYDVAGNLIQLVVNRVAAGDACLGGAPCKQRFLYDWDEVGRLNRARRWDLAVAGSVMGVEPTEPAAVELRYSYDGNDQRVLKTAVDVEENQLHTAYVFGAVELRRSAWSDQGASVFDYDGGSSSEVGYLFAHGARLARLFYEPGDVPEVGTGSAAELHVLLEMGDHLGSSSMALDKASGELTEKGTYQAFGGSETDYRPERWKGVREDYRFTGKEEDSELGVVYFGKRFLLPLLGRWANADPLAIHVPGQADLNLYAYIKAQVLRSVDPLGLCGANESCDYAPQSQIPSSSEEGGMSVVPSADSVGKGEALPDLPVVKAGGQTIGMPPTKREREAFILNAADDARGAVTALHGADPLAAQHNLAQAAPLFAEAERIRASRDDSAVDAVKEQLARVGSAVWDVIKIKEALASQGFDSTTGGMASDASGTKGETSSSFAIVSRNGSLDVLGKSYPKEIAIAKEFASKGYDVVLRGKAAAGADMSLNGVPYEIKTLESASVNAVRQICARPQSSLLESSWMVEMLVLPLSRPGRELMVKRMLAVSVGLRRFGS
jgi:RHS repeat-associated protein